MKKSLLLITTLLLVSVCPPVQASWFGISAQKAATIAAYVKSSVSSSFSTIKSCFIAQPDVENQQLLVPQSSFLARAYSKTAAFVSRWIHRDCAQNAAQVQDLHTALNTERASNERLSHNIAEIQNQHNRLQSHQEQLTKQVQESNTKERNANFSRIAQHATHQKNVKEFSNKTRSQLQDMKTNLLELKYEINSFGDDFAALKEAINQQLQNTRLDNAVISDDEDSNFTPLIENKNDAESLKKLGRAQLKLERLSGNYGDILETLQESSFAPIHTEPLFQKLYTSVCTSKALAKSTKANIEKILDPTHMITKQQIVAIGKNHQEVGRADTHIKKVIQELKLQIAHRPDSQTLTQQIDTEILTILESNNPHLANSISLLPE